MKEKLKTPPSSGPLLQGKLDEDACIQTLRAQKLTCNVDKDLKASTRVVSSVSHSLMLAVSLSCKVDTYHPELIP